MRQSLLQKPRQPPRPVIKAYGDGFMMFVAVLGLILASIAFYIALRGYLDDQAISINSQLECAQDNVQRATTLQDGIAQDKALLDAQTAQCEEILQDIEEDQFTPEFIEVYRQINETIVQTNATCNAQVDALTTTLMQLINGTNATADLVGNGVCQFNTLYPNQTTLATTAFQYYRLRLNGIEFYYYQFGASTSAVLVEEAGARIENCSPIIFRSDTIQRKPLYVDAGGLTPSTYAGELRIGQNMLEILPETGSMHTNQTLQVNDGFQVWLNLF